MLFEIPTYLFAPDFLTLFNSFKTSRKANLTSSLQEARAFFIYCTLHRGHCGQSKKKKTIVQCNLPVCRVNRVTTQFLV